MVGAVSNKARRQRGKCGGHLAEVVQADRNDHAARRQRLTVVQREVETLRYAL